VTAPAPRPLRIATRASRLALWQAGHIAELLRGAAPGVVVEIVHVSTAGDLDQAGRLSELGGLGIFTREVQKLVLEGRADLAVHSLKDLPTEPTPGLVLAAVPEREESADALVLPDPAAGFSDLASLPGGARLGTGSLRRQAQLLHVRPDLQILDVRGNVETRLRKLDAGDFEALILAVAGLRRLGLADRISRKLTPPVMYAAVGQGALGVECRQDDAESLSRVLKIDDPNTRSRVTAERALLSQLRAGCHAPVGAATRLDGERLVLEAVVLSPNGKQRIFADGEGPATQPAALGRDVADRLLQQGAGELIGIALGGLEAPRPAP
jgi:hydroxymethylbilane synthase